MLQCHDSGWQHLCFAPINSNTYLLGTIDNIGMIEQNAGVANNGGLAIANSCDADRRRTVTLDTASGGTAYLQGNGQTLTNTNNTIQGTGVIGNGNLVLINNSVVDATPEGGTATLVLNGGGVTNTHLLEATAGGVLTIDTNVNNSGGTITASGTLSTVDIEGGVTITGGTLSATSTAVLETAPGSNAGERHDSGWQHLCVAHRLQHVSAGRDRQRGNDRADRRERTERRPIYRRFGDADRWRDRAARDHPDQWRQRFHRGRLQ